MEKKEMKEMEKALLVVVQNKHLVPEHYERIREAIERAVGKL